MAAPDFPFPRQRQDILRETYTIRVSRQGLYAALHCMLLGEVTQANRVIDLLYKHNAFEYDLINFKKFFHYAWNASGIWPKIYTDPEDGKLSPCKADEKHGPSALPELEKGGRQLWYHLLEKDEDTPFTFDDFTRARALAGEETGSHNSNGAEQLSVQLALELGLDEVAGEVIREHLVMAIHTDRAGHRQRWDILNSPRLWDLLCDGWLRKELGVSSQQVEDYATDCLDALEERFSHPPPRPLERMSMKQLCHLFDKQCLRKKRLGGKGAAPTFNDEEDDSDEEELTTILKPAASESAIQDLETKIKQEGYPNSLPEDYKAFLRVTNGLYLRNPEPDNGELFRPVKHVEFDELYLDFEMIPNEAMGCLEGSLDPYEEWPARNEIKGLQLGAGGDEGLQLLVPQHMIQKGLEAFDNMYEKACPSDRIRLERAAKDMYGGVEQMRALEWMVVRTYHWDPEVVCFVNFRALFEETITHMFDKEDDLFSEIESGGEEERVEEEARDDDEDVEGTPADRAKKRHRSGQDQPHKRTKSVQ